MKANLSKEQLKMKKAVKALKGYSALTADIKSGKVQGTKGENREKEFYELLLTRRIPKADKALVQAYLDSFEGKPKAYKKRRSVGTKSTAKGSTAKRTTAVGSKPKATTQPKVESKPKAYADSDLRSKLKSLLDLHDQGILTDAIAISGIKALLA